MGNGSRRRAGKRGAVSAYSKHQQTRASGLNQRRGFSGWLLCLSLGACGLSGCANFWDEVTSKDFHFKDVFATAPDPLEVIQKSPDGDKRAKALRSLQEPLQNGGGQLEQDTVVNVLVTRAATDPQALCRLAAINSLRHFKDPRAVEGLKEAYYRAGSFNPETATIIRCQTLDALGETGQPTAVETLVKVLREPPVDGTDQDRQQKMDERIAAARALGHFRQYQSTEALVSVLRSQQDVALRDEARSSLVAVTGKDLPADAQAWNSFLNQSAGPDKALVGEPSLKDRVLELISFGQ
jgi:hypothetical protein